MNSRPELDNSSVEHEFERTFFSLNSLPSEIRWKIFGFLAGSIDAMRLVLFKVNIFKNQQHFRSAKPGVL